MNEPLSPAVGQGVLHLFCTAGPDADGQAVYAGLLTPQGTFVDDVVAYR